MIADRSKPLAFAETAAVLYLLAPLLAFFVGFIRVEIAVPACGIVLYLTYEMIRRTAPPEAPIMDAVTVYLLLLAALWIWLSGGIGPIHQNSDWFKHYQILRLLTEQPWPAIESLPNHGDSVVRYYLGWYLIPALILKLTSGALEIYVISAWSLLGIFLFFNLVRGIAPRRWGAVVVPLVFVLFGGADYIGTKITGIGMPNIEYHYEWWAGWIQFSSNTTSMFWVPQHAIAAWLGVVLLWRFREREALLPYLGLLMSAILLWSPFSAIGLIPFLIVLLLRHGMRPMLDLRAVISSVALALPVGLYLIADAAAIPQGYIATMPCPGTWPCFSWLTYLRFLALEVGLALTILFLHRGQEKGFLIAATVALCLIPLYKMGGANDFAMRVSLPALAVVAVLCGNVLASGSRYSAAAVAVMLLAALPTVLGETARGFLPGERNVSPYAVIPSVQHIDQPLLVGQYFARLPVWVIRSDRHSGTIANNQSSDRR